MPSDAVVSDVREYRSVIPCEGCGLGIEVAVTWDEDGGPWVRILRVTPGRGHPRVAVSIREGLLALRCD